MTSARLLILLAFVTAINIAIALQHPTPAPAETNTKMSPGELNIRYGEVYLQLAKLQLQRSLDTNKQVPGTFTNVAIEAMRQVVYVAEEQLKALQQSHGQEAKTYVISAEVNAKGAMASYNRVKAINQASPGTIAPTEVERLRLTAELANLNLLKARAIGSQSSPEYVQWQLDQLREDFFQLRNQLAQFSRMN